MHEFVHMGGYAFYVWTSYGLAVAMMIFNLLSPIWRRREIINLLIRRQRGERHES